MSHRILLLEDDLAIAQLVRDVMQREGHHVLHVTTVREALIQTADNKPDLFIVDWMLPDSSGIEFIRRLRTDELHQDTAILMLTAKDTESNKVTGFDAGADDYVSKPFSPRELAARVNALLRRTVKAQPQSELKVGNLCLNVAAHEVSVDGQSVQISGTEFRLLRFLMENPNRVFSRNQLLDHVWGVSTYLDERTVDVHMLRLRKSLKPHDKDKVLQTVRGAGYKLSD